MQTEVYSPDAKDILDLRTRTNAPMLECRRALIEMHGDVEKAIAYLRDELNRHNPGVLHSDIELYR